MEERTDANDLFHEQMITILRPQIQEEMIPMHVLFYLPMLSDVARDIMIADKRSRREANDLLIDKLLERRCHGWYRAFVDALISAEFDKLAKRLTFKEVKNDDVFKNLINTCMPDLLNIQLMPVMGHLLKHKVISQLDIEEIIKLERESHHVAVFDLLSRLSIRREDWIGPFAIALRECDERTALKALDPMLESASSDESIERVLTDLEKGNTEDFESDPEKLKKLSEDNDLSLGAAAADGVKESPAESKNDTIEEGLEFHESRQPSLEVNAPNFNISATYQQDKDYNKVEKLSARQVGVAKPMVAGGRLESSDLSDPVASSSSQRTPNETVVKEVVIDDAIGGETPIKQPVVGTAFRQNRAIQETTPKTLSGGENQSLNRRTLVYRNASDSDEEDYGLRSDLDQIHVRAGAFDSASVSCSDNNFQQPRTNAATSSQPNEASDDLGLESGTLIPDRNQSSESVERRVVPNEVFVSNLPTNVRKNDVVDHFGMIGDIKLNSNGEPRVHLYRDKTTRELKGEALITFANEIYANAAVEIFNGTEFEGNILNVEIAWRKVRSPSVQRSSAAYEEETVPSSSLECSTLVPDPEVGVHEDLKLRSYQEELAAKAKAGANCIIVAPTGSGKTHVAMEIIRHHVDKLKRRNKEPKIVFFVPTVALVEQQRRQFARYLHDCKILGLSGDQDGKLPLSELVVPLKGIVVMTPQILENALKENDIETLSIFSLMIFDECHHTSKSHPYNMIMSHYIDENLDRSRQDANRMPQVVGLTASVGVGKSKSMEQAVNCILRLCANMAAVEICTVREHMDELIKHVNRPEENTTELSGRKEDPFFSAISRIMGLIEDKMKTSQFSRDATTENAEFGRLLQSPAERGGDRYTQWMSRLQRPVDAIYEQKTRRFYVACLKDLQIYNTALLINADCRTKDALDYIVKEFNPAMVDNLHEFQDGTDTWLKGLFETEKQYLNRVSLDPKYENPKLNHLKKIICEEYHKAPDSRGIIFCKTREMTVALVNWMMATPELKKLNPHNLVGSNAPSNKAGMTQVKQEDVLTYFKRGNHQLIVATSVAEEGLDVQKCNIVIRYEHVTNQIARVQSRGRARADNAQYLVVAEKGRGAAEKEENNKIREKMMQKAIDIIDRYKADEKHERIRQYQKEAQVEREMAKKGKEISKILKASQNANGSYTLRCLKCDSFAAYSTDIRKIEASHHVILDADYKRRIIIRPHPAPKKFENFELTGKIFCKKCHADWGIMGVYKKVSFPVVKVCSFILINENDQRRVYKRWKEVPFTVNTLSPNDLEQMMRRHLPEPDVQQSTDDDDGGEYENEDSDDFGTMYD